MATATTTAPEVFTETTEDAAARAEQAAPKRRGRKPRNTTAPAVKPMFSDTDEENNVETIPDVSGETVDTDVSPADIKATEELNSEDVDRTVDKERRMQVRDEFVPGKSALVTLTPDALKELAFVSTYNTVDDQSSSPRQHGYQRDPMAARFPAIGRYFAQQEGDGVHTHAHLITPIIASVRVYSDKDRVRFNFLFDRGDIAKIHQEFGKSVFSIVDGQHRMGGLYWAWENKADFNPDVPVMVYYGLRYADEATLFDDINTNQRKLPKALIEATKVHMEAGEKTHAQVIREIAFGLAQDGDSPWYGLINMTGARDADKPITYEGLRRSISNMMHENLVNRLRGRGFDPENVAKNYWTLVTRASANAWNGRPRLVEGENGQTEEVDVKYRLKDLVGVAAVSRLGQDIIASALDKSRTAEEFTSAMAELVSRLGEVDWVKEKGNPYMASSAGFAGMGDLYKILYNLVYLGQAPGVAA